MSELGQGGEPPSFDTEGFTWRGKPIESYDREGLIKIAVQMARTIRSQQEAAIQQQAAWRDMMKRRDL